MQTEVQRAQPAEGQREWTVLGRLALPIILTNLTMFSMAAVDTLMIGHKSKEDLAAMGLALVWLSGTTMFASGVLFGMDPVVSQAHGAQNNARIRTVLGQGWVLAALLTPVLFASWWWTETFLLWTGQDPALAESAGRYARWVSPSAPFLMVFTVGRQWLQGRRILRPILVHALWTNILNVVLNYMLIFGHWGAPALGLVGAAQATSVTRFVLACCIVGYIARHQKMEAPRLGFGPESFDRKALVGLFLLGLPVAFQLTFEIAAFGVSTIMAGLLGTVDASAHLVVLNIASITFMIPLGIGLAASARIGNLIGEGKLRQARHSAKCAFAMGAGIMAVSALVFWLGRYQLPRLYTHSGEVDVRQVAALILPVAAFFQIFDGIQVVGSGVLRGAGQTRPAAFFNLVGYWPLAIPLGYYLTFHAGLGIRGIWWGLALGLAIVASGLVAWWWKLDLEKIGRVESHDPVDG